MTWNDLVLVIEETKTLPKEIAAARVALAIASVVAETGIGEKLQPNIYQLTAAAALYVAGEDHPAFAEGSLI